MALALILTLALTLTPTLTLTPAVILTMTHLAPRRRLFWAMAAVLIVILFGMYAAASIVPSLPVWLHNVTATPASGARVTVQLWVWVKKLGRWNTAWVWW